MLACLVAGCSASGADFELSAAPEGQGTIHIYRVNSFTGYSDAPDVKIDGKLVGTLKNAGFLTQTVDPGPHEIEVRVEFMKLFGGRKVSVDVEPGQNYYFKVAIQLDDAVYNASGPLPISSFHIRRVDADVALAEIKTTKASD